MSKQKSSSFVTSACIILGSRFTYRSYNNPTLLLCSFLSVFRYVFRSGNPEHPGDKFYNTSVQVLSSSRHSKSTELDNQKPPTEFPVTEDSFYVVNHFNHDSGVAEGAIPAWLGPIDVLRLYIQYPSTSWAILNEVC